jgi:aspartyl-tRNA(Asn)/glutamyl-tRNA(Gln) amidotransferase subunit B
MPWETVIGLEVHVQLATQTKIFSGASTAFGAEPNTQACAIDLAMPGTLPTPNAEAFKMAAMFGLGINAEINRRSHFERKNYFYPDLPKGYQTTQLAQPIVGAGFMEIETSNGLKQVRIHHAHLEEDAGKSLHEDFHGSSGIDLNRAGTPLIEVVSEPDMSNAEEAVAFAKKLHALVTALGICDGEMSQGSLRFDVNISVRRPGEPLGTRTETKNLNSFKFMEEAIELEVERQITLIEGGGKVRQETRLYNGDTKKALSLRPKEDSNDYRYFPCPDLLPVELDDAFLDAVRAAMPELPAAKAQRYQSDYGLPAYDAGILSGDRLTSVYFETAAKVSGQPKLAANWVMGEVAAQLNRHEITLKDCPVSAEQLGQIIARIFDGTITSKSGKTLFDAIWEGEGDDADALIKSKGLQQMNDSSALEKIIDEIIAANTSQVEAYRAAPEDKKAKMLGFFTGQAMKASKGQANPQQLNALLLAKLN